MWWRAHHLCVLWRVNSLDIQLWAVDGGFKAFVQFSQNGSNAYSSQKKKLILGSAKKKKKSDQPAKCMVILYIGDKTKCEPMK